MLKKILTFWRVRQDDFCQNIEGADPEEAPIIESSPPSLLNKERKVSRQKMEDVADIDESVRSTNIIQNANSDADAELNDLVLKEDEMLKRIEIEAKSRAEGLDTDFSLNPDDFDSMIADACRLVVEHQQGSTSLIQRKLKIGYNRAGRIVDQMEVLGVIGPFTGATARDVMFHDSRLLKEHLLVMGIVDSSWGRIELAGNKIPAKYEDILNERTAYYSMELAKKKEQEERDAIIEEILAKDRLEKDKKRVQDLRREIERELASQGIIEAVPQYERSPIPQTVKNQVWNRDMGKCVECGSSEHLEFDHIIPLSKGGANTYRNVQLLCEPCNRAKSNKIG